MKITIQHSGQQFTKEIPTSWTGPDAIRFRQFIDLADCSDDVAKILSVLTGIEPDIIRSAKIENLESVLHLLSFLNTPAPNDIPKTILDYPIPEDLGFKSIGQFEDLKSEIKKIKGKPVKEQLSSYILFCAMYACDPYDWKEAEMLAPKFLEAPAAEVLAVGSFTLVKLTALKLNIQIDLQKEATLRKKNLQGIRGWLHRLDSSVRFASWKRQHLTKDTSSRNGTPIHSSIT